jgi:hypothetical protein
MAKEQFGVQLHHLTELQKDWHAASRRVEEISQKLGDVKAAIARAAATDLAAAGAAMREPAQPRYTFATDVVAQLSTGATTLRVAPRCSTTARTLSGPRSSPACGAEVRPASLAMANASAKGAAGQAPSSPVRPRAWIPRPT